MTALDLSTLGTLSDTALDQIKKECDLLLRKRTCKIGAVAWFEDKGRSKRYIRITGVNPKTVSGVEVDFATHAVKGGKWRVSHSCLRPVGDLGADLIRPAVAPTPNPVHEITTAVDDAW